MKLGLVITTFFFCLCNFFFLNSKDYIFTNEPIDVVIPCHSKDLITLEKVIEGIKKNGNNVRNVYLVSSQPYSENAIWFDETQYPFSKKDIALEIFDQNEQAAQNFINAPNSRIGWIYQQFLKLYAPYTIPNISSNVLVLDADTIFLKSTSFQREDGSPLFNIGEEYTIPYFVHAQKLIPGFRKVFPKYSGICHYMLFQRSILDDLFKTVEKEHFTDLWRAICHCIDHTQLYYSSFSEYEIYFNFCFMNTKKATIKPLKWKNLSNIKQVAKCKKYNYISCHSYLRK